MKQDYTIERQILFSHLKSIGIKNIQKLKKNIIVLNPVDKPDNLSWNQWQFELKKVALYNQDGICGICRRHFIWSAELHHALLTKADVRSNPKSWMIHHSFNVVNLDPSCHKIAQRDKCLKFLCEIYSKELIEEWYNNFPMKTAKLNIF